VVAVAVRSTVRIAVGIVVAVVVAVGAKVVVVVVVVVALIRRCSMNPASPILKWAGGKGRLLPQLLPLLPPDAQTHRYIEPFVGAGALFFKLAPERAILGDANSELITVYTAVKGCVEELIANLERLAVLHAGQDSYYAARDRFNAGAMSLCQRAALFIYLNRTCFNGLYRVNKAGSFNVPYGRYTHPRICDPRRSSLSKCGASDSAPPGRRLHADTESRSAARPHLLGPPVCAALCNQQLRCVHQRGFGRDNQTQLAETFRVLNSRGCYLILSNSDTPELRTLYKGFCIHQIQAPRGIGANPVQELVITNY
jgi:DNA adenine methylase